MAIERKAYSCEHKCGKVRLDRKAVEKHEALCLRNPERRSCVTCKHDVKPERRYSWDTDHSPEGGYCGIGEREVERCVVTCPKWEASYPGG